MAETLGIWLDGLQVATVDRDGKGRLSLSYTRAAKDAFDGGTPVLSVSLPVGPARFANQQSMAFLDGLLPEGEPRRAVAAELDVAASDVFALLAALGRDCAGALVIGPLDHPAQQDSNLTSAKRLSAEELAGLIANLRNAPLGIGDQVRLSLAGVQEKLLLSRLQDGGWAQPVDGSPSTHILKPSIRGFEKVVENEFFCMRLAFHLGLSVAAVETMVVNGAPVLVVERYDRRVNADGATLRVHQEDLCQALGLPPSQKYHEKGGPSLLAVTGVLRDFADSEALESLLRAVTLNVLIGNCDAHGKNFSLLRTDSGGLRLAPLYDLLSTRLYEGLSDHMAMPIDTVQIVDRVTSERITSEASAWGMPQSQAEDVVSDILTRLPEAIAAAQQDTPNVPKALVSYVKRRRAEFRDN